MVKKSIILLFAFSLIYAQDAGTYAEYLTYWGTSGRTLGMCGAFTGLADDASAGYFNPAGLVQLNTHQLSFMHSRMFTATGVYADILMYGRPASAIAGYGFTVFHVEAPGIERSETGYKITDREITGLLTYSGKISDPIWGGINGKIFYHMVGEWMDIGFGLDGGLYFFPDGKVSFGLFVQNILPPKIKFIDTTEALPLTVRSGVGVRPFRKILAVDADVIWTMNRNPVFALGVEYRPISMLLFRCGINGANIGGGLGIWQDMARYEVQLDYSFSVPYLAAGGLGLAHNVSLSIFFGGYRAKAFAPIIAFSPTSGEEGKNITWLYFDIKPRTEVKQWQVLVKDEAGTVVRKIGDYGEPPYRISWDGKDDNGLLVRDGRYYYSLYVVEKSGRTWEYGGFLSEVTTVGPPGTILIKSKAEAPKYMLEEKIKKVEEVEEKKEKERKRTIRRRR